jgi:glucose-6-phosphate 1-epimerase
MAAGSAKLVQVRGQPAVALHSADGARATVLLHGGHVVSWIPAGGEEQLYLSPRSAFGDGASIRGGVPVIFPQFSNRGTLPKHGLARTRAWTLDETPVHAARGGHAQAVLRFAADARTRRLWPHDFEVELTVAVVGRQLDLELVVANRGEAPFEFTAALHTYLRTGDVVRAQLEGLQTVKYEDNTTGQWQMQWGDVTQVVGALDRIYHDVPGPLTLREAGRRLEVSMTGFTDAVVWNPGPEGARQLADLPDEDWTRMLCVEAARIIEPVVLPPGEEWAGMQSLSAG